MTNEITVYVNGGVIQEITGIPEDVTVKVVDRDIDGSDEEDLTLVDGEMAYVSHWNHEEPSDEIYDKSYDETGEDRAIEIMEKGICECERMFEPDWDL